MANAVKDPIKVVIPVTFDVARITALLSASANGRLWRAASSVVSDVAADKVAETLAVGATYVSISLVGHCLITN